MGFFWEGGEGSKQRLFRFLFDLKFFQSMFISIFSEQSTHSGVDVITGPLGVKFGPILPKNT